MILLDFIGHESGGSHLTVARFRNNGRAGEFYASGRVLSFELNSYPQHKVSYRMAWRYGGPSQWIDRLAEADLMVCEHYCENIQENRFGEALFCWSEGNQKAQHRLNDLTAVWDIEIRVWRDNPFCRWFPQRFVYRVGPRSKIQ